MHQTSTTTKSAVPTTQEPVSYPKSVKIARISPRYFRLTEPAVRSQSSRTFVLYGSSAFNVTQRSGIVYVSNEDILRSEPTIIQWVKNSTFLCLSLLRITWRPARRWTISANQIDISPWNGEALLSSRRLFYAAYIRRSSARRVWAKLKYHRSTEISDVR